VAALQNGEVDVAVNMTPRPQPGQYHSETTQALPLHRASIRTLQLMIVTHEYRQGSQAGGGREEPRWGTRRVRQALL
jgi:hypothetical protein